MTNDLIAAIATAPGRGGVGVVRLSGPGLAALAAQLTGGDLQPRHAHYREFHGADGGVLDTGLALFFPGPHSFTGEDVVELQGHGGPVVLNMLLRRCLELGARLAAPGEFTRRAFLNGKLDLAQAESVADLIDAESEAAARSAVRSLQGAFSREITQLLEALIHLRMLVEASLDFPEEDIDFLQAADAQGQLSALQQQLAAVKQSARQGSILRDGLQVVLIGQPNVGKSSLLNCLAGQDLAIVTDVAGTTRDTVRQLINIDGVALHIIDTAGLRDTEDVVEQMGIARTWATIEGADLALLLLDSRHGVGPAEGHILARLPARLPVIHVFNKIDLLVDQCVPVEASLVAVSAKSGAGIDELRRRILMAVGWAGSSEGLFLARTRHLHAIDRAAGHLLAAEMNFVTVELMAEELHLAQLSLAEITGEFSANDLLGEIFSRFCIGK